MLRRPTPEPALTKDEVSGIIAKLMSIDDKASRILRLLREDDDEEEEDRS